MEINPNNLVEVLAIEVCRNLVHDEVWQCFGYNKRPKNGLLFKRLFPKRFQLKNRIDETILILGLVDIAKATSNSTLNAKDKKVLIAAIISQILELLESSLNPAAFTQEATLAINYYLKDPNNKMDAFFINSLDEPLKKMFGNSFLTKSTNQLISKSLEGKNKERYLWGIFYLVQLSTDSHFLNIAFLKKVIEKNFSQNEVNCCVREDVFDHLIPLLQLESAHDTLQSKTKGIVDDTIVLTKDLRSAVTKLYGGMPMSDSEIIEKVKAAKERSRARRALRGKSDGGSSN